MHENSAVTPQLVAMATADSSKAKTATIAEQRATLQLQVDKAFESNDYGTLGRLSKQMETLLSEELREATAKLEARLCDELAEVLEVYAIELLPFSELRIHLKHEPELAVKVTLMNSLAPAKATVAKAKANNSATVDWSVHGVTYTLKATKAGQPTTESLLEIVGDELHDGRSWKVLFAETKGQSNPDYQLRLKLLKSIKE